MKMKFKSSLDGSEKRKSLEKAFVAVEKYPRGGVLRKTPTNLEREYAECLYIENGHNIGMPGSNKEYTARVTVAENRALVRLHKERSNIIYEEYAKLGLKPADIDSEEFCREQKILDEMVREALGTSFSNDYKVAINRQDFCKRIGIPVASERDALRGRVTL
jgi:hypothetical protein